MDWTWNEVICFPGIKNVCWTGEKTQKTFNLWGASASVHLWKLPDPLDVSLNQIQSNTRMQWPALEESANTFFGFSYIRRQTFEKGQGDWVKHMRHLTAKSTEQTFLPQCVVGWGGVLHLKTMTPNLLRLTIRKPVHTTLHTKNCSVHA